MATQVERTRAEETPIIPDRLYFKIGDVARICGLEAYVLRFWESQFPQLKPNKSGTGQRLYRRRDVEMVLEIKQLVHSQGYTLAGARQALDHTQRSANPPQKPLSFKSTPGRRSEMVSATIAKARAELREIAGMLASAPPAAPRQQRRSRFAAVATGDLFSS